MKVTRRSFLKVSSMVAAAAAVAPEVLAAPAPAVPRGLRDYPVLTETNAPVVPQYLRVLGLEINEYSLPNLWVESFHVLGGAEALFHPGGPADDYGEPLMQPAMRHYLQLQPPNRASLTLSGFDGAEEESFVMANAFVEIIWEKEA